MLASRRAAGATRVASLSLAILLPSASAATPGFAYRDVGFDSGGWVTGLYAHAATGIVYQRTDVGGAYRSDDGGATWAWLSGNFASADYAWTANEQADWNTPPADWTQTKYQRKTTEQGRLPLFFECVRK